VGGWGAIRSENLLKLLRFEPIKVSRLSTQVMMLTKRILPPLLAVFALSAQDGIKKVTLAEANAAVTMKTAPEYPAIGRQLKIEGKVELEAVVAENGMVEKVNIVSGNPVLTKPAAEAVKHWKFTPFADGGKPCKAIAPLSISFKL
jgi:TonB family protein